MEVGYGLYKTMIKIKCIMKLSMIILILSNILSQTYEQIRSCEIHEQFF